MKKKINNQAPSDKQLSLNFKSTTTNSSSSSNASKGKVISFEKYNNYSSNNLLRDIIHNTKSF